MYAIDEAMTDVVPIARPDAPVTNRVPKAIIVAGIPLQIATITRPRLGARLGLVPLDRPALGFVAARVIAVLRAETWSQSARNGGTV